MPAPPSALAQAIANNDAFRAAIVGSAMPMQQPLATRQISGTVTSANNIITIAPKLTGLWVGFLVEVNCTVDNAGAGAATRTAMGALNIVKRFQFVDLQNQTRINTNGFHLGLTNSLKMGRGYGQNVAPNLPFTSTGWTVQSLASAVAAGMSESARVFYWVPVAYSWNDLRGAIFGQVINATSQLQITLNDAAGHAAGADSLFAVAGGLNTTVTLEDVTVRVWQCYYDQLPRANGIPLLPVVDLSTMYMLQDTTFGDIIANQDNTFPFANFRTYLSSLMVYNEGGVNLNFGSDVTYWALQYANLTRQFEFDPQSMALFHENQVGYQPPPATYYFDHRAYPISTANYGNAELVVQPSTASAGTYVAAGYEMFAQQQMIVAASSLPQT